MGQRLRWLPAALVLAVVLPAAPARAQPAGRVVPPAAGAPSLRTPPTGRFVPPAAGPPSLPFSLSSNPYDPGSHRGVDYRMAEGTPVKASGQGVVSFAGPVAGQGLFVTIDHPAGLQTGYSFLSRINVVKGQAVSRGWVIGLSGQGHPGAGVPGLHLGARQADRYIDPLSLFLDYSDISGMIRLVPQDRTDQAQDVVPAGPDLGPAGLIVPAPGIAPAVSAPGPKGPGPAGPGSGIAPGGPGSGIAPGGPGPAGPGSGIAPGGPGPGGPGIPKSSDPKVVGRWWKGLDEEQKQALIQTQPKKIAGLNGVDSVSRDKANRLALDREITRLQARSKLLQEKLRSATATPKTRGYNWSPEITQATKDLERVDRRLSNALNLKKQLKAVAADPNDSLEAKDVLLLEYDTAFAGGDGKAVIALGDPYQADYVGVVVPGVGSAMNNVEGVIRKASAIRLTFNEEFGPPVGNRAAVIAWLGYDTPQSIFDAIDLGEARAGAADLKTFIRALRKSNSNEQMLLSVFGHSYGSTTSGVAAKGGTPIDNLGLLGSPGATVQRARQLKGARAVWAATGKTDPIRLVTGLTLGADPASRTFGARKIPLDQKQTGHDKYFMLDSRGVKSLAAIMVSRSPSLRQ